MRPRVLILPWYPGWSYASTAAALTRHLADRFDIRISYDQAEISRWAPDVVLDMSWKNKVAPGPYALVKQISSHRWQRMYGSPRSIGAMKLEDADLVAVPSRRLHRILTEALPSLEVRVCGKGFEPTMFSDRSGRRGPLVIGWAGNAGALDKGVKYLRRACPQIRIADSCLTLAEMPDFYSGLDVISCASSAEGDPRPVIEAMASGCYVVSTDVGIVPELVRDRRDGLIVERSTRSFVEAFAWCSENLSVVRAGGRDNSRRLRLTRRWSDVAPSWGDVFDEAIWRRTSRSLSVEALG